MKEILDLLKNYLNEYYLSFLKEKKPVAYLSAMAPQELFKSFGFNVFLPENHSAYLGVKRKTEFFIKRSVQEGFSPEICTYLLTDIGSHMEKRFGFEEYGLKKIPKPNILCYSTNQCYEIGEWFKFLGRFYKVPVLSIPSVKDYNGEKEFIKFYEKNLLKLIKNLENFKSEKLNESALINCLEYTKEASFFWEKVLNLNKKEYKFSFLDHLFLMAPMVLRRGENETINFYKFLYEKAKKKENLEYKYRLWWEGMPVWGKLRYFKEKFEELKIGTVGSTYGSSWIFSSKSRDLVGTMSEIYYKNLFITFSEDKKIDWLVKKAMEFNIDGFIFMEAKTCHSNTNTYYGLPQKIFKKTGIPYLILSGDMVDLNHFSEAETNLKLEAFLETIEKK